MDTDIKKIADNLVPPLRLTLKRWMPYLFEREKKDPGSTTQLEEFAKRGPYVFCALA